MTVSEQQKADYNWKSAETDLRTLTNRYYEDLKKRELKRSTTPKHIEKYEGVAYYFCCAGCRATFLANPQAYLARS